MESKLYKKHLYLNKNIDFIIATEITEYDMKDGGYSLCKEYKLLPQKLLDELGELPKKERHIKIGKLQRKDKELSKMLNECFSEARRLFFSHNDLEDSDILSIKKDAIFVIGKTCSNCDFGKIHFRGKNVYSSYAYLADCEFYYNSMIDTIDIKNINDDVLKKHEKYMTSFIKKMFKHLETSSQEVTLRYLKRFIDNYKNFNQPLGYYREYTKDSVYNVLNREDDDTFIYDNYWDDKIEDLDISFNYNNIIIPFLRQTL